MLLFATWQPTTWRGEFASLRPQLGGRTRLVIIYLTFFNLPRPATATATTTTTTTTTATA